MKWQDMKDDSNTAMVQIVASLMATVLTRDVTEEFGLRRVYFSNVRVKVAHCLSYTNVNVLFDAIARDTLPEVSTAEDGLTIWDMKIVTIEAKETFWRLRIWRRPTKLDEAKMVRKVILKGLSHEIDECLTVNGVRVFEPHKPPKQPRPLYWQMLKHRLFGRKEDL